MLKYIKQYASTIDGIEIYPIVSQLIFVFFFIGVIWFVRRMTKAQVQEISQLPLEDAETVVLQPKNQN